MNESILFSSMMCSPISSKGHLLHLDQYSSKNSVQRLPLPINLCAHLQLSTCQISGQKHRPLFVTSLKFYSNAASIYFYLLKDPGPLGNQTHTRQGPLMVQYIKKNALLTT